VIAPLLEVAAVAKAYGGLRPLRIEQLIVQPEERVALVGLDQPMAEVLVNLITGATLPDRGTVTVFGEPTGAIADGEAWLRFVDRFGIVSNRAVMMESMTAIQNLAMPFTLDVEPPSEEASRLAGALADEVGLPPADLSTAVANLDSLARALVRLARAVALTPSMLLLEHPTALVDPHHVAALARRIRAVAERRSLPVVAITADETFGELLRARVLRLEAATGRLIDLKGKGTRWFGRLRK
jgi:ABC-type transporter Mla maintaining outer membrane lipid asymmetry ATPase subunit MlaF